MRTNFRFRIFPALLVLFFCSTQTGLAQTSPGLQAAEQVLNQDLQHAAGCEQKLVDYEQKVQQYKLETQNALSKLEENRRQIESHIRVDRHKVAGNQRLRARIQQHIVNEEAWLQKQSLATKQAAKNIANCDGWLNALKSHVNNDKHNLVEDQHAIEQEQQKLRDSMNSLTREQQKLADDRYWDAVSGRLDQHTQPSYTRSRTYRSGQSHTHGHGDGSRHNRHH
jgi:hypothetical protein